MLEKQLHARDINPELQLVFVFWIAYLKVLPKASRLSGRSNVGVGSKEPGERRRRKG
jgi:hypothetical protein